MRFPLKAAATVVSVSALAMANLPTSLAAPAEQNFNGKESCITIDSQGNVRAPQPGDCTQFGKGGQGNSDAQARNVIFILGDGMGHQEITAARNYLKGANGRFEGLDELTASGAYTTFAINGDAGVLAVERLLRGLSEGNRQVRHRQRGDADDSCHCLGGETHKNSLR